MDGINQWSPSGGESNIRQQPKLSEGVTWTAYQVFNPMEVKHVWSHLRDAPRDRENTSITGVVNDLSTEFLQSIR